MRRLVLTMVITLSLGEYAWASSPTEQLRAYTDQVMKALENPTLTASARLEAVRKVAGQAFDVTETAKRALGLHWQRRTSAEREEFVQLFRDLLERGYLSRIGEYGGEQIKYVSEQVDGDYAIVRALIVTKKETQGPSRVAPAAEGGALAHLRRPGRERQPHRELSVPVRPSHPDDLVRGTGSTAQEPRPMKVGAISALRRDHASL